MTAAIEGRRRSLNDIPAGVSSAVGGLIGVVILFVAWWLAAEFMYPETHAIPTPWKTLGKYFSADDWDHLINTFKPTISAALWGFLYGDLAAFALAIIVLQLPWLKEVANQIAVITYCLPPVALGPIIVLIAGPDSPQAAPIIIAALAPFFTTVVGCLVGLNAASKTTLDVVTAYGGGWVRKLTKVRLISAMPNVFAALQIAAPAAFLGAVLAEFVGGGVDASVGKQLILAQQLGNYPSVWWLALTSAAVAGLGYALVGLLARIVTAWAQGLGMDIRTILKADPARAGQS